MVSNLDGEVGQPPHGHAEGHQAGPVPQGEGEPAQHLVGGDGRDDEGHIMC